MTYTYQPRGVCSRRMTVVLEDGIIRDVRIEGGCSGNLQGMKGIPCGGKPSSCPDQLSIALEQALKQEE